MELLAINEKNKLPREFLTQTVLLSFQKNEKGKKNNTSFSRATDHLPYLTVFELIYKIKRNLTLAKLPPQIAAFYLSTTLCVTLMVPRQRFPGDEIF